MSKWLKKMEMDALSQTLGETRDFVLLSWSKVSSNDQINMRLALRKKNIFLQMVKNTLASLVLKDKGIQGLDEFLAGPTVLAWGANSVAELSKELDSYIKKNPNIQAKTAVADGAPVPFADAKNLPTREQALATLAGAILGPGAALAACLQGPAGQLASQLKQLSEEKKEGA